MPKLRPGTISPNIERETHCGEKAIESEGGHAMCSRRTAANASDRVSDAAHERKGEGRRIREARERKLGASMDRTKRRATSVPPDGSVGLSVAKAQSQASRGSQRKRLRGVGPAAGQCSPEKSHGGSPAHDPREILPELPGHEMDQEKLHVKAAVTRMSAPPSFRSYVRSNPRSHQDTWAVYDV